MFLDFDGEDISTRSSVLIVVISCNDSERGWLSWAKSLEETSSVSERVFSSGVQEVLERNPSSGEISISDGELHNAFLGNIGSSNRLKAWSNALNFSLRNESAWNLKSELGWSINWLVSLSEEHSDVHILETSAVNFQCNVTRELTESWVRSGDGV